MTHNPYDEFPYRDYPIAQTAPESLATISLFHGGPRVDAARCRVLELGCASGANLLALAWFRPDCQFVGVDNSAVQIERANQARLSLGLDNLTFVLGDFDDARRTLEGPFDIVMAHGVFSWVPDNARDALLNAADALLAPEGLLYLNYNTLPGWNVRGMVRDFLLANTAHIEGLAARAEHCHTLAAAICAPLGEGEHPYTALLEREFRLILVHDPAYLAHEYLAPVNQPYWQHEFESLLAEAGFAVLADANFNGLAERIVDAFAAVLEESPVLEQHARETADLLCYSQMRSPILARSTCAQVPCSDDEFRALWLATPLERVEADSQTFAHPDGRHIDTGNAALQAALDRLAPLWPAALSIADLFTDPVAAREDLELLFQQGLGTLRSVEPGRAAPEPGPLHEWERQHHGLLTSPWHSPVAS